MFCSFKVGPKNNYEIEPSSPETLPLVLNNPNSTVISNRNISSIIDTVSAKWARDKPKIATPRNVGGTKKNKWSAEEDEKLRKAVERLGTENWRDISLEVEGRTGKQCRERWLSHMCPSLSKEEWTPQEDLILLRKQSEIGNRWAIISKSLPGRSTTAVKNRWNYLCRRDIPNHSEEFEQIVANHQIPEGLLSPVVQLTSQIPPPMQQPPQQIYPESMNISIPQIPHLQQVNQIQAQPPSQFNVNLDNFSSFPSELVDSLLPTDPWGEMDFLYADFNQFF